MDLWIDFGVTLEPLKAYEGDLGRPYVPRKSLWAHFGATLIPLRGHLGPILASDGRCRGLWNHFELTLGALLACENEFGIIMVSSYSHEAQFSKNNHFPNEF